MEQVTVVLYPDYEIPQPVVTRVWAFRSYDDLVAAVKLLIVEWMGQAKIIPPKNKTVTVTVKDVHYKEGGKQYQVTGESSFASLVGLQNKRFTFYVSVTTDLGKSARRTLLQYLFREDAAEWSKTAAKQAKDPKDRTLLVQRKIAIDLGVPVDEEVEVETPDTLVMQQKRKQ